MKTLNKIAMVAALAGTVGTANAQVPVGEECGCPAFADRTSINLSTLTDANGNLTSTATLTCDNAYVLDATIYVSSGAQLIVQAGTVVRANDDGTGLDANSIVVTRGGQIIANGTESCPIQFTAIDDQLDGNKSLLDNGEWGGLVILGRATNNLLAPTNDLAVANGIGVIEGFDPTDVRVRYGNPPAQFNDNDNSGILRYVSIRHGGGQVGDGGSNGNDLNGLTLGSVGRGTVIEHVEVVANFDDGIEFFGGTVDVKYASVIFAGDDQFDYDQGYTGRNQFLYALQITQGDLDSDEGFEADGDDEDTGALPFSAPVIYNATIIGNGSDSGVLAKEGFGGRVSNSIFGNFQRGVDLANDAARPFDALQNFNSEALVFSNNCFVNVPTIVSINGAAASTLVANQFAGSGNAATPGLIDTDFTLAANGVSITNATSFVPAAGTAISSESAPVDGFFTTAKYCGAFAPGSDNNWLSAYSIVDNFDFDNSLVSCPADLNGDGQISSSDFIQFSSAFNTSCEVE